MSPARARAAAAQEEAARIKAAPTKTLTTLAGVLSDTIADTRLPAFDRDAAAATLVLVEDELSRRALGAA